MKRMHYSEEQIINILKEHEAGRVDWQVWAARRCGMYRQIVVPGS